MQFFVIALIGVLTALPCGAKAGDTVSSLQKEGIVQAQEEEFDLSFDIRFAYEYMTDPEATDGKSLKVPNGSGSSFWWEWNPQVPDIAYDLFVSVKILEPAAPEKVVLRVSVADKRSRKTIVNTAAVYGGQLKAGRYTDILIGRIEPNGKRPETYIMAVDDGSVPDFYADRIFAVPVLEGNAAAKLRLHLAGQKSRQKEIDQFIGNFKVRQYPDVEKHFVYGAALAWEQLREDAKLFDTTWQKLYRRALDDLTRHYCNQVFILSMDARKDPLLEAVKIAKSKNILVASGQVSMIDRDNNTVDIDAVRSHFEKLIPLFEKYDNFQMWYLEDEPTAKNFYAHMQVKAVIEELDSKRPAIALVNRESTARMFGPYMQIMSLDCYPTYRRQSNPWFIGDRTAYGRRYAKGPLWMMIPAYSSRGMKLSTAGETRIMTYQALLNGAKGIQCYIHSYRPVWTAGWSHIECLTDIYLQPNEPWDEMKQIGRKLVPVGQLLMNTDYRDNSDLKVKTENFSAGGKERPAIEIGVMRDRTSPVDYIVALNNDPDKKRTAVIEGKTVSAVYDLYSLARVGAGKFSIELGPAEGRIYARCSDEKFQELKKEIFKQRYRMEKGVVDLDFRIAARNGLRLSELELYKSALANYKAGSYEIAVEQLAQFAVDLKAAFDGDKAFSEKKELVARAGKQLSRANDILNRTYVDGKKELVEKHKAELIALTGRFLKIEERLNGGRIEVEKCEALNRDSAGLVNKLLKESAHK